MEKDKILESLLEGQRIMMAELQSFRREVHSFREEVNSFRGEVNSKLDSIREEVVTTKEEVAVLKRSQDRQDRILEALAMRSMEQETEIKELKRIK